MWSGKEPLNLSKKLVFTVNFNLTSQESGHRIRSTGRKSIKEALLQAYHTVGSRLLVRDGYMALLNHDHPMLGRLILCEFKAHLPGCSPEKRLMSPPSDVREKTRSCVGVGVLSAIHHNTS